MSKSRHRLVEVFCEYCGISFLARKQRVDKGQSKYCSRKCYQDAGSLSSPNKKINRIGKENAGISFDKTKNSYFAFWNDSVTGKRKTTTYARWWWEMNMGEVPSGYRASYKDGNPLNIEQDNIILISSGEFGERISKILIGHSVSFETKKKIAIAHTGNSKWNGFINDDRYPGFSKRLRRFIKERDEFECKACGINLKGSNRSRVHHIDGNKKNSNPSNLVLVCVSCHSLIHSKKEVNDAILSFRSQLHY